MIASPISFKKARTNKCCAECGKGIDITVFQVSGDWFLNKQHMGKDIVNICNKCAYVWKYLPSHILFKDKILFKIKGKAELIV